VGARFCELGMNSFFFLVKSCARSGMSPAAHHSSMPSFQIWFWLLMRPLAASTPTSTRVNGPAFLPPIITYQTALEAPTEKL
jgi:hypothetical protein